MREQLFPGGLHLGSARNDTGLAPDSLWASFPKTEVERYSLEANVLIPASENPPSGRHRRAPACKSGLWEHLAQSLFSHLHSPTGPSQIVTFLKTCSN